VQRRKGGAQKADDDTKGMEGNASKGVTAAQAEEAEKKKSKFLKRLFVGWAMIFFFFFVIFSAHVYVVLILMAMHVAVFKEMITVRYNAEQAKAVPLFRTIQWAWFLVAMYYTYGNALYDWSLRHEAERGIFHLYVRYHDWITFGAYSLLFVITVLHFKKGSYKYQFSQLTWTLLTIVWTLLTVARGMRLVFGGLIWYVLSSSLIACNDTFAYFCGRAFGKKYINRPFLELSPNKTWEGFIGGGICTILFASIWPLAWIQFKWLICPMQEITFVPFQNNLQCDPSPVFLPTVYDGLGFPITYYPIQLHCMVMAAYASVFAPFGGFFASAIKRAYQVKDFNNIIPGHGGFVDRLDCQFLMMLSSSLHLDTFVRSAASVPMVMSMVTQLSAVDQQKVYDLVKSLTGN
jgi:phosphatidate cytidylyltransferase